MNRMSTHQAMPTGLARAVGRVSCMLAALLLCACAAGPARNAQDPFEPVNRSVSRFNEAVDSALLKPVAQGYQNITPALVRTGVSNFFNNISDYWSFLNSVAQAKPEFAADNLVRFGVNTVFGLVGILDIASEMNIERHREDFGQTLGRWGVPSGPYVVLPLLGPSTVRDSLALTIQSKEDLVTGVDHVPTRNSLYALRAVESRANLLRAGNVLDEAALDKYTFTRDFYLQRRRVEVDGDKAPDDDPP